MTHRERKGCCCYIVPGPEKSVAERRPQRDTAMTFGSIFLQARFPAGLPLVRSFELVQFVLRRVLSPAGLTVVSEQPLVSVPGLFSEEALGQDGSVQWADRRGVVSQAPHGGDATKLTLGEETLGLVNSVLLFSEEQLLPHVVLKLIL